MRGQVFTSCRGVVLWKRLLQKSSKGVKMLRKLPRSYFPPSETPGSEGQEEDLILVLGWRLHLQ